MKQMKKIASLILALVMVFSMTATAFAAAETENSLTIKGALKDHTYELYQIFTGTLGTDGNLGNIVWGNGITEEGKTAFGDAQEKANALKSASDAAQFAKDAAPYLTNGASSGTLAETGDYTFGNLEAGYYLVKEKANSQSGANESYTSYILEVAGKAEAALKADKPTSEKKVKDVNDSVAAGDADRATDWQDSADYDIGDKVPFQLKGTLPNNYDSYSKYRLVFHDKESAGLTFDKDSVEVKIDGTGITSGYEVVTENLEDGCTFEVVFADLKTTAAHNGSVITVEYKSALNENAVIGALGNPNEMYMEFSNNPNHTGEGDETGNTPKDVVIVFTYKVVVNKTQKNPDYDPNVEGSKEYIALSGAEFELQKKVTAEDGTESWQTVNVVKSEDGTQFTFSGLDDGEYQLKETKTPAGYNTIAPITFKVTGTHDVLADAPELTALNGEKVTGEIKFTASEAEGSLVTDVVNLKGAELPSTGGMGTTIFYIVGCILTAGAAILLITKKRMSMER